MQLIIECQFGYFRVIKPLNQRHLDILATDITETGFVWAQVYAVEVQNVGAELVEVQQVLEEVFADVHDVPVVPVEEDLAREVEQGAAAEG